MTGDTKTLAGLLDFAWRVLDEGAAGQNPAARHPTLATVGVTGGAEARTVVLRGASQAASTLTVHTDAASAKTSEIAAEPQVTLLVWDDGPRLQIRVRARVAMRPGTNAEWNAVPDRAKLVYGGSPPPGTAISAAEGHDPNPDPGRFVILTAAIAEIEVLHLGKDRHRRAIYRKSDGFRGGWLAP